MQQDLLDFFVKIAWPLVALVGILFLGPGGLLKGIVGDLSKNLLQITDTVAAFKDIVGDLRTTIDQLNGSTKWVGALEQRLSSISSQIESVRTTTEELAVSQDSRLLEQTVPEESQAQIDDTAEHTGMSPDQMFNDLRVRWESVTEKISNRLASTQFDARSIGEMARKLTDGRRQNPISQSDAALIATLSSQFKRFTRLQSSKDEWLTPEVYSAFIRGVDQALSVL